MLVGVDGFGLLGFSLARRLSRVNLRWGLVVAHGGLCSVGRTRADRVV